MPTASERSAGSGEALPSFSELINGLLGLPPDGEPLQVHGRPLGDLLNAQGHELVHTAAKRAHQDGAPRLDAGHLLWATAKVDPSRSLFQKVSVDPDVVAVEIGKVLPQAADDGSGRAERGLSAGATRAIADAETRAKATGSALVGPEHILDALLTDPDSGVVVLLDDGALDVRRLRMFAERAELRLSDEAGSDGR
jgi:ATP-dependent Clp protease ATP-binding subunit ClpC